MKVALGENVHASCYNVRKRRRGWTELVTRQRFAKLKKKINNSHFSNVAAEDMDVCKDQEENGDGIDEGGKQDATSSNHLAKVGDLELVCKNILLRLVSAAVDKGFFQVKKIDGP